MSFIWLFCARLEIFLAANKSWQYSLMIAKLYFQINEVYSVKYEESKIVKFL